MGSGEIVEVVDEVPDARRHVERFEHVRAHERVQVVHGLHRDRLVEEVEDLVRLDPQATTKGSSVLGEPVEGLGTGIAKTPLQLTEAVSGFEEEVLGDGEIDIPGDEEPLGLPTVLASSKDLGDRDRIRFVAI